MEGISNEDISERTNCESESNAESIQSNIKENKCKGTHFEKRGLRQIFVRINGSRNTSTAVESVILNYTDET